MEGIYKRKSFPSKRLNYNKLTLECAFLLKPNATFIEKYTYIIPEAIRF
jgi:hypothetical protein